MPYQLIKFEKEQLNVNGELKDAFVALIKSEADEQPFRVTVENIETKELALNEVQQWIAAREKEDADRVASAAADEEQRKKDAMLNSLNEGLTQ